MALTPYVFLSILIKFGLVSSMFQATIASTDTVMVNIKDQGLVLGNYDTTTWTQQRFMQFRGIPYAESPKGDLRYKAPVPREPWNEYVDATDWGRRCPVITTILQLNETQLAEDLEDCLNLCVYTKNLTANSPVMLYVHGGGFYNGTSLDHPPKYLMEKDIVLIVPQYRIGALGFMGTSTDEIPGNAAIADVIFALQWVQDHIATFGGDPQHVTIFGQSAGSILIGALLISPITPNGYFQRAIMQSGSILGHFATLSKPREQAKRICKALNCPDCQSSTQLNACLMNASVPSLLNVTKAEDISPIIGDKLGILTHHPAELFKQFNKNVSILTGFTKHDGSYVLGVYYDQAMKTSARTVTTVRKFIENAMDTLMDSTRLINNLETRLFFNRKLLDSTDHAKALPAYFDLFNVLYFKSPALAVTSQIMQKSKIKPFLYTFDYEGEHTRFGYEMGNEHYPFNGGVHHSNDYLYLFSSHTLNAADTEMAKKMVNLWTSFAITGQPNDGGGSTLQYMETESGPYFHINENVTIGYDIFDEFTVTIDDPENYKLLRPKISFL